MCHKPKPSSGGSNSILYLEKSAFSLFCHRTLADRDALGQRVKEALQAAGREATESEDSLFLRHFKSLLSTGLH